MNNPIKERLAAGKPSIGSWLNLESPLAAEVMAAAREALEHYGPSMTGSRLLNGTSPLHVELEELIAEFLGTETALVFSTGYLANLGTISALVDKGCTAVIDKADHASIYDGAAMAVGDTVRFHHNDPAHLEETLSRLPATDVDAINPLCTILQ